MYENLPPNLQENQSQSSEQVFCQILGWYLKKWTFKYDFVDAVPNFNTRWYTGTIDFHLLFESSELYSIFPYFLKYLWSRHPIQK